MTNNFTSRLFSTALFLLGISTVTIAQRTPNVQDKGLWSASPVNVDGKIAAEIFQASNKSTLLSYTMSNDDKNLYLVMKSTDKINNSKIMMGGITLAINTEGKKKEKEAFTITYPVIVRQQGQRGMRQGGISATSTAASADSAALARGKQLLEAAKEIKVLGFKDIPDSLISIYNEYEILAAAGFDNDAAYVYELAVPLKLLGLTSNSKDFAYNIKINGIQFGGGGGFGGGRQGGGGGGQGGGFGGGGFGGGQGGGRGGFDPSAFLPTDFWGKYTLAKK